MYRAKIGAQAHLQIQSNAAYNFGAGDFTVVAMIATNAGGTVVARKGTDGGPGNGGFLLVVNPNGTIKFATDNGFGYSQVVSVVTRVLDGDCHTVIGVRSGATLSILLDGVAVSTVASGNATPPLVIDNSLPVTIGCTQQSQEPANQFVGAIMNVSLWNRALAGDSLVKAAFARVDGSEPNLQGFWSLDGTTNDLSPHNNPAQIVGPVSFEYCLDCVWATAANGYCFTQIANMPDAHAPAMTVTLSSELAVTADIPALAMSILAMQDTPAFPVGATVTLTDPSGHVYNQEQNTNTLFAHLSGSQLWALMVVNPVVGVWHVSVTAPATTGFQLNFHTVPTTNVVGNSRAALNPLFESSTNNSRLRAASLTAMGSSSLGGFWDAVWTVAVGAVVGVVAVGVVILSGGTAIPAVVAGLIAFTATEIALVQPALDDMNGNSVHITTGQVGGMAGFGVAAGKLLLFDANVDADAATQLIYKRRSKKLYPAVTASTFNKVQSQLVGNQVTRANIKAAFTSFTSGYVTGAGHGLPSWLTGWYVSGNDGPLQDIISTVGAAKFAANEVNGRIFHFFACETGYLGTAASPGLGRAMVAAGAVAFFGYNVKFIINVAESPVFCDSDIQIDLSLIQGDTCATAYQKSYDLYTTNINTLRANGNTTAAAQLESNRNGLVSPTTNAVYGNPQAKLVIK